MIDIRQMFRGRKDEANYTRDRQNGWGIAWYCFQGDESDRQFKPQNYSKSKAGNRRNRLPA